MKFSHSVLLAASVAAPIWFAPAFATEREAADSWPADAGAWRYQTPPASGAQPSEELPTPDAIVDFVLRATDPAQYRGAGTAGVAERAGGRYVFDVWFRGRPEHSLVLLLPQSADEVPSAWLLTRRVRTRISVADLMRMVDRALDWSRRDAAQPETGVTWRPVPPATPRGA